MQYVIDIKTKYYLHLEISQTSGLEYIPSVGVGLPKKIAILDIK